MVNAPNIERVISSIKGELEYAHSVGFDMVGYIEPVGKGYNACIAAHAYLAATGRDPKIARRKCSPAKMERIAQRYLGIDDDWQAFSLFFDLPAHVDLADVTREDAISTLQRLAETGRVEWRM